MNRTSNPFGIVSLLLVLVGVGLFMAWQYGGLGRGGIPDVDTDQPVDVTAPPRDVASNPRAARRYVEASVCTSNCVSTDRVCRGTAIDPPGLARCAEQLETCRTGCTAPR